MQSNPVVVDGVLYATTPTMQVVAVNAATGKEVWKFDPSGGAAARTRFRHRGVAVHADRVFVTYRNFLIALDKATGQPIPAFGARRPGRPARGTRQARRGSEREREHAGRRVRGPADPAEQRARDAARHARPHPRVRREDRASSAGSSTPFRSPASSATSTWPRRRVQARRRRQRLGRRHGRPGAGDGVCRHRLGVVRLLRRDPQGRQPVRRHACWRSTRAPASASGTSRA